MDLAPGKYLINGSGGIGWGLAASIGAAIGQPDAPVVAIVGDGSALYASEAMWTAAHHGTRVVLVILANGRYATLNEAAHRLTGKTLESFTIEPPAMDFAGLAQLYEWRHVRVTGEDELHRFLATPPPDGNTVLELKLDPRAKPACAARHF
jgi:benzoylformate decarboxylase